MVYLSVALVLAILTAAFFAVRFFLLRRSIKDITADLGGINVQIEQNNILRLPSPDRQLEELLNAINDTLVAVRSERADYLAREREFRSQIESISHDLRTPLTVIIGYLRLKPERDDTYDVVLRKALSMQKLVSQFYDYSRIISGDYPIKLSDTDMCRIVRETFADNCFLFEEKGLSVAARFSGQPAFIYADGGALERVVANILQNASRYAHKFFAINFSAENGYASARFYNDAADMTEEELSRIFDRFYMADGSRSAGGTGLGLTIAKNLASQMKGRLTAELVEGKNLPFNARDGKDLRVADNERCICFELAFAEVSA